MKLRFSSIVASIGLLMATVLAASSPEPWASQNRPDAVYEVEKTVFAYYQSENKTVVMAKSITVFDNSGPGFQYVNGAQRVELFLVYEFKGRTLTHEATSVKFAFESRSSLPRLTNPDTRVFQLIADGSTFSRGDLTLEESTVIGFITWQQTSIQIPIADFLKFLTATRSAAVKLGDITYSLTAMEFARLKNFAEALRVSRSR